MPGSAAWTHARVGELHGGTGARVLPALLALPAARCPW